MQLQAQTKTVTGHINCPGATEVRLTGFNGFGEKGLATARCDSSGNFTLEYAGYTGAARLQVQGVGTQAIVLLGEDENPRLKWENTADVNSLVFDQSAGNAAFAAGIRLYRDTELKLAGLRYLLPQYSSEPKKQKWIEKEKAFQQQRFQQFTRNLPQKDYAAFYLEARGFISNIAMAGQLPELIPWCEETFRNTDFGDERWWHSGLMGDLLAGYYRLMARNGSMDEIYARMDTATGVWLRNLGSKPERQMDVAEYCFKMLEQQNLTAASEYLAKAMLRGQSCQPDDRRTVLFEQYRKMVLGNTAPDILLDKGVWLSKMDKDYKLVIFGESECPNCQKDYPSLMGCYRRVKDKYNVEFVYISLDTDKKAFGEFYREAPFITLCDTKGWDSPMVKEYCVFATPTYFLLNRELKIVAKLKMPEELENLLGSLKQ